MLTDINSAQFLLSAFLEEFKYIFLMIAYSSSVIIETFPACINWNPVQVPVFSFLVQISAKYKW